MGADQFPKHDEIPVGIFLRPEDGGRDLVGRIVDGAVEDQAGPASLEPVMVTAVPLEEQSRQGHAFTPTAEAAPPSGLGARDAGGQQDPMDRGAREDDAVVLREFLGQVLVIEAPIPRPGQSHDPPLQGRGDAIGSATATIPMGQGSRSVPTESRQQPAALAQRESQQSCRASGVNALFPDLCQYDHSLLLDWNQGNRLPGHAPRVTESLFAYGVTLSLFIHNSPEIS